MAKFDNVGVQLAVERWQHGVVSILAKGYNFVAKLGYCHDNMMSASL